MTAPLHHLLVGPARHGVTRYAEMLLRAAEVPEALVVRLPRSARRDDVPALLAALPPGAPVHTHVTDHLFGADPEEALDVVAALAAGRDLAVTLHDLPQPSDGTPYPRRRRCYAGIVAAAAGVVVSSAHEDALLDDVLAAEGVPAPARRRVVPLAAPPAGPARTRPEAPGGGDRDVAVLGFVYPGKGHEEVLDALEGLPADVGLRVVGGPSPGHEDLLARLGERAGRAGRRVRVDGWVDDADLPDVLREVAVPVFAPRHVSASASLASWHAAGRRPVATRSRYTEEVAAHRPGSVLLVDDDPDALAAGLRAALDDPSLTELAPQGPTAATTPAPSEAAEAARLTFEVLPS